MTEKFDFIVVGAGSAGCVLANRLSKSGQYSVCLIEAGPADKNIWIHIPIGYGKTMFNPKLNWGFHTQPEPTMADREIYWPRGKTLGGCSSINGLIYIRGQQKDYDHWAELGNSQWGWKDCLPYFKKLEDNDLGASETRGVGGPMSASSISAKHPLVEALIESAGQHNIPRVQDFNSGDNFGAGYYQLTTRNGLRCSTAVGYLKPVKERQNLTIYTDTQVKKIIIKNSIATGVIVRQSDGVEKTLLANKEVVLSAGALQSPQLLQLSGVGPAELLKKHGIEVMKDLPGVGRNLQDHLQFRLIYKINQPITNNDQLRSWFGKIKMGMQWAFLRKGPLAIGINQGAIFSHALDQNRPDVQVHFGTLSADMAGGSVHDFSGCTFSICQLRPESRGEVQIASNDAYAAPNIHANYLSTELDRQTAIASIKLARTLTSTAPFSNYVDGEFKPGRDVQTDDEILRFCREQGATIFHPSGTAKMGPDSDPWSVVDQELKVKGIQHLRVVDASIMPTLVSGNTNIPVVMIAEKAAEMMLKK